MHILHGTNSKNENTNRRNYRPRTWIHQMVIVIFSVTIGHDIYPFGDVNLTLVCCCALKNVYDKVMVLTSSISLSVKISGSTKKLTGISMLCPGSSTCSVKQKQSILEK